MKLTEERLVKMILEELDEMGEAYRGSAGQPLTRAQSDAERMKRRAGQVNPIVTVIKMDLIKGSLPVGQEVYNAIQRRKDLTDDQKARVILKED